MAKKEKQQKKKKGQSVQDMFKRKPKVLTPAQVEEIRTKDFFDCILPSTIKFMTDHYIIGDSYRCVWVIREYPPTTEEQAILAQLADRSGVTLRIYHRLVESMEQRKIVQNATRRNKLKTGSDDMNETIEAQGNLQDVIELLANLRKNKEPLLHCSVFLELKAKSLDALKELQSDIAMELTRSKISVDRLTLRQKEGFLSVLPVGSNQFGVQFERVLPASSVANLYPFNFSGKTDPQGLYIGRDMALLPNDHKAKWFAGAALNTAEQSMASVMSTALSRLNSFLDSELEQLLCFDTEIDAESFCGEKSAIFIIMPEENPNTFFMISLIIQQLYREILAVADENGGKLKNRCVFFCDEFGTLPKIESAEMMFSASRSRRLQIVPIIQSFSQLDKNYGKEGSEIIVDNTQVTLFGGFAPNSSSAEILSKALGSRTVMSGSVSRSKNDPSQSLQMMERPLLTSDELKSLPKGDFVVMKTGVHPMKVHLKLFFKWGIAFDEEHPYSVPEHGNRKVQYAEKKEIQDGIMMKYHPKEAEEAEAADKEASGGGQAQHQAEANEPPQSEPPKEKKGKPVKTERHDRTAQEVLAEVTADGQA